VFDRVRCTDSRQTVVILFAIRFWGRATVTSPAALPPPAGASPRLLMPFPEFLRSSYSLTTA
jgi:hypothetical protein